MRLAAYVMRAGAVAVALGIGAATAGGGVASAGTETGIVKWWHDGKGFGFITPDSGGKDLFAHFSEISRAGFKTLREGEKVEFEVKQGPKGLQASNIHVVNTRSAA